jgi:predicted enzyme related to lactoylglutathione lyase
MPHLTDCLPTPPPGLDGEERRVLGALTERALAEQRAEVARAIDIGFEHIPRPLRRVRRRVDDLDAAVDFYEALTGNAAQRFSFAGAELAAVGSFLLFEAVGELGDRLERVAATITVSDLDTHCELLAQLGADIEAPLSPTPNGRRLIARHPDGAVIEYVGR